MAVKNLPVFIPTLRFIISSLIPSILTLLIISCSQADLEIGFGIASGADLGCRFVFHKKRAAVGRPGGVLCWLKSKLVPKRTFQFRGFEHIHQPGCRPLRGALSRIHQDWERAA